MVLFWVLLGFDRNLDVFLIYRSIICILFFQLKDFLRRASVAQINIYGRVKFVRARAHEIRKRALVLIHPIICLSICILAFNLIGLFSFSISVEHSDFFWGRLGVLWIFPTFWWLLGQDLNFWMLPLQRRNFLGNAWFFVLLVPPVFFFKPCWTFDFLLWFFWWFSAEFAASVFHQTVNQTDSWAVSNDSLQNFTAAGALV